MKKIIGLLGVFLFVVCLVSCNAYILRTEVIASDGKKIALKAPASESIIKYGKYQSNLDKDIYIILDEKNWEQHNVSLDSEFKLPPYPYEVIDTNTIECTPINIYGVKGDRTFVSIFAYDDEGRLYLVSYDKENNRQLNGCFYYVDEAQK